jgi:hypothetical protein
VASAKQRVPHRAFSPVRNDILSLVGGASEIYEKP